MNIILWTLIVSLGINIFMFIPAFIYKTDKLTDISYAVTFMVVAVAGFLRSEKTTLQLVTLLAVLLWALRLGTFLFIRINRMKRDKRFDGMREHFFAFLRFWLLQGLSVFVVMLAASFAFKQAESTFAPLSYLGLGIFAAGLLIEATADAQKFRFSGNPANKDKWIDVGIWRKTRHPNYLGEMMVWTGVYLLVAPSLVGADSLWALLSPLYIICLLLFVSGIPLLEKAADKKWGSDKRYQTYKRQVPVLIPSFKSISR